MGFAFSALHYHLQRTELRSSALRDEQRKLELRAAEQFSLLQAAIQCISDPFWIYDPSDKLVVFNAAYVDLSRAMGFEPAVGMAFRELYKAGEPHLVFDSPEERVAFRQARMAAKGGAADSFDFRLEDGRYFRVNKRLMPDQSVVHIAFDRTPERQESAHLVISANAFEAIDDPFWIYDADNRLILFNTAFSKLCDEFGCQLQLGMHFEQIYAALAPHFDRNERDASAAKAQRATNAGANVDTRFKDGRLFSVRRRVLPNGHQVQIGFDRSIEERRARELEQARLSAESANRSKTEFLTSMSHELRTPMNAVLGFAQLLRSDKKVPLSAKHQEMVELILDAGKHLLSLIDDVLDLARIESESAGLVLEPVSMDEVLTRAQGTLTSVAEKAQVHLSIGSAHGELVHADRRRVLQLVLNLASNAIKYNHAGGNVSLTVDVLPQRLRVSVVDDGMGVPEEARSRLFQPFQRAGRETGPITGTGIGLTITQRLAELMGGAVGYEPLDPGSRFWIELPRSEPAPQTEPTLAPSEVAPTVAAMPDATLLYVEDNAANQRFLEAYIETRPELRLVCAPSAEAGLEVARASDIDLLLLDIHLPGMSGLEALPHFRELPGMARTPAVAVSASAFQSDRERAMRAGFDAYLSKPLALDALEEELERLLGKPERTWSSPPGPQL